MVVAMVTVRVMQVTIDEIVYVISMWDSFMSTTRPVNV